jgi:hypothetical protein
MIKVGKTAHQREKISTPYEQIMQKEIIAVLFIN